MRRSIICCVCVLIGICCDAQKQGNVWLFGVKAGLNFNTSPPTMIAGATGGPLAYHQEGTSCISDSSGRLLFYCDGSAIYNRLNDTMRNGSNLLGNRSSTQSSIIVPKPGSDKLFYVFTSDALENYVAFKRPLGYNYSIVNMCIGEENSDTLGAVVAGQKNIHLVDSGTEKLCVAYEEGGGYWILGHKILSDTFLAWHLTATGLSSPVTSRIGPVMGNTRSTYSFAGQMKFNPAGTKVAAVTSYNTGTATLDLFDFNPLTGKLSNYCKADLTMGTATTLDFAYGVEFSPNGSKVYASYYVATSSGVQTNCVVRFSLSSSCAGFGSSRDTIFLRVRSGVAPGGIQAAPDGNLYVGYVDPILKKNELHRINNPNGIASYDTSAFIFPNYANSIPSPPSLIAGYKYHNRRVDCSPQPSAVSTLDVSDEFQVSPNPANEFVTFTAGNRRASKDVHLIVTDAIGRAIYERYALPARMDLSLKPQGLYYYRLFDGNGFESSGKFIVRH